jgi:hypothetical protein
LLKFHAECLKPIAAASIDLFDGSERCIGSMRLHNLEDGSRDRLLRPSATKRNALGHLIETLIPELSIGTHIKYSEHMTATTATQFAREQAGTSTS